MDNNKPVTELPVKAPFDFAKWWDRVGILIVLLVLLILIGNAVQNGLNGGDNSLTGAALLAVCLKECPALDSSAWIGLRCPVINT